MERRVQMFEVPVVSVRASWGPVEEAMVRLHLGVEVPIPSSWVVEFQAKSESPATPEAEEEKRTWPEERAVEVARPDQETVVLEPPTMAPPAPVMLRGPETARVEVATVPRVLELVQYERLPEVGAEEVLMPLKVKAPVELL